MAELSSTSKVIDESLAMGLLPPQPTRLFSVGTAASVVLSGYILITAGLYITDAKKFLVYLALVAALGVGWFALVRRKVALRDALVRESGIIVVGSLVFAVIYPFFAGSPYQIHVMAMGGILALMALGLNVNIGNAGLADFGYIAYYAIGAYASALLNLSLGIDFWLCVPLAGLIAAVLSLSVSFPALRVKGHYLALVTLGFAFIVIQMITNLASLTGGTQGISGITPPNLLGHSFRSPLQIGSTTLPYQANYYYLILIVLTVAAFGCARLNNSRWGRAWAAMQADDVAAEASGLNLVKLKLIAFGTGAFFGGVAGSLYAHMIGYIDPSSFRFIESVFLLAIVVLGNFRIGGVIVAAVIFTIFPEKLRAFDDYRLLIFGVALLAIMLIRGRKMIAKSH